MAIAKITRYCWCNCCGRATFRRDLALANLDEPIDPQFPALEQFNHVLVYVPGFRGGRVVDCTDKNSDLPALNAPMDLGRRQGVRAR